LQRATLLATDLSDALLWSSTGGGGGEIATVRLSDPGDQWRPLYTYGPYDIAPWRRDVRPWNEKAYQDLRKNIESMPPSRRRDEALQRIRSLDCAAPNANALTTSCDPSAAPSPEAAAWRKSLEGASVDDKAYGKALAGVLKGLVCSGIEDSSDILRGLLRNSVGMELTDSRLEATGPERQALVDAIKAYRPPLR
jgi:hypothetical protein